MQRKSDIDSASLPDGVSVTNGGGLHIVAPADETTLEIECEVRQVTDRVLVTRLKEASVGDRVRFEAEQGRGAGDVARVEEDSETVLRLEVEGGDDQFCISVPEDGVPTAEHHEYIPSENAYEVWSVGEVMAVSVSPADGE